MHVNIIINILFNIRTPLTQKQHTRYCQVVVTYKYTCQYETFHNGGGTMDQFRPHCVH